MSEKNCREIVNQLVGPSCTIPQSWKHIRLAAFAYHFAVPPKKMIQPCAPLYRDLKLTTHCGRLQPRFCKKQIEKRSREWAAEMWPPLRPVATSKRQSAPARFQKGWIDAEFLNLDEPFR